MRRLALAALICLSPALGAQATNCPDSTDTPSLIDYAVDKAYAAWRLDPGALPRQCLLDVLARKPLAHTDSAVAQALALDDAILKQSPEDAAAWSVRLVLLSRAHRYAEVAPALTELFSASPGRVTPEHYRLAIAAAMRLGDSAAVRKQVSNAAGRFASVAMFAREEDILRQLPRLHALIDTVQRRVAADPTLIVGYANLSSIYGNLNRPDSALAYARIALHKGVSRSVVATALESQLGVTMRHAQIMESPDVWRAALPVALAIDSTVSTPASKYLVALTLSEIVVDRARLADEVATGGFADSRTGLTRKRINGDSTYFEVLSCPTLAITDAQVTLATKMLDSGGDKFSPQTVPAIRAALREMRGALNKLKPACPGS